MASTIFVISLRVAGASVVYSLSTASCLTVHDVGSTDKRSELHDKGCIVEQGSSNFLSWDALPDPKSTFVSLFFSLYFILRLYVMEHLPQVG